MEMNACRRMTPTWNTAGQKAHGLGNLLVESTTWISRDPSNEQVGLYDPIPSDAPKKQTDGLPHCRFRGSEDETNALSEQHKAL